MRYTDDFINLVRNSTNIVDIIGQHCEFKRTGHNLVARCPFPDHAEKTPSFSVSDAKQAFFCFGCKRGGDVFNFLERMQGMSFVEAVEYLATRAHIALPKVNDEDESVAIEKMEKKKLLYKVNKHAGFFFHKTLKELPQSHYAWKYIKKRGLTDEMIDTFKIGFCPDGWTALTDYFSNKKAPMNLAEELGLIKPKRTTPVTYYDIFRNRLMFPIIAPSGEIIGFGGRIFTDGQPKYLNSPESPLFSKSKVCYGLFETAKYIRTQDQVIVVEGYMDMLALYQAGIKNVVATLGTALTVEHAKLLKRFTKNIIVLYDGDSAGKNAAERSLPLLLSEGLSPKAVILPDELDPDEFILEKSVGALKKLLDQALDLYSIVLDFSSKGFRPTASEQIRITDKLSPILNTIKDPMLKELYLQETADRIQVTTKWLDQALQQKTQQTTHAASSRQNLNESKNSTTLETENTRNLQSEKNISNINKIKILNPPKEEKLLLSLSLKYEKLLKKVLNEKITAIFTPSGISQIFELIENIYGQANENFDKLPSLLAAKLEDPGFVTSFLAEGEFSSEEGEKIVIDCIKRVRQRHSKAQTGAIAKDLKTKQDDSKLEQFMNIVKNRHSQD